MSDRVALTDITAAARRIAPLVRRTPVLSSPELDARFGALEERLTGIEHEVTEVRIAVARLEGPPRRLISVR